MEHQVHRVRQQAQFHTDGLAHPPPDPVTDHRLAQRLGYRESGPGLRLVVAPPEKQPEGSAVEALPLVINAAVITPREYPSRLREGQGPGLIIRRWRIGPPARR